MREGCWVTQPIDSPLAIAFSNDESATIATDDAKISTRWLSSEVSLTLLGIFVVLALMSSNGVPGVNETHYLTKAKHFWNPEWCQHDLFLESSNAHFAFFSLFGWPTLLISLDLYAWIGRVACWIAMTYAWFRLNSTLSIRNWMMPFTAAILLLLSNRFDMAGEWVVGGFEAKSVTYVFVILALDSFLRKRDTSFWAWLGLGCIFHLVIGVWALFCFSTAYLMVPGQVAQCCRTKLREIPATFWLFVCFVVAAVVPAVSADFATDSPTVRYANQVQVHQRLAHHLLFGSFPTEQIAKFVLVVIAWTVSCQPIQPLLRSPSRFALLRRFCNASLLISLAGLMLSAVTESGSAGSDLANLLLKLYWFRFSDFAIPVGLSCVCGIACGSILSTSNAPKQFPCYIALTLLSLAVVATTFENLGDSRPPAAQVSLPTYENNKVRTEQSYSNFVKACRWAANNTSEGAVFVTPYNQQIFKWYANRAEVACWKDAPQDALGIAEWRKRISWLSSFEHLPAGILQMTSEQTDALVQQTKATHVFAPQALEDVAISNELLSHRLTRVYPDSVDTRSTYVIYQINQTVTSDHSSRSDFH